MPGMKQLHGVSHVPHRDARLYNQLPKSSADPGGMHNSAAGMFGAAAQHYAFAVNAAIVDQQFSTAEGSVHLASAGLSPVRLPPQPAPQQVRQC